MACYSGALAHGLRGSVSWNIPFLVAPTMLPWYFSNFNSVVAPISDAKLRHENASTLLRLTAINIKTNRTIRTDILHYEQRQKNIV
jgi:hypothetical protein